MGVNNRRPKMKLDLLFFLQGISLIQGTCDSGNRDCNCVDSSFAECSESAHPDSFHVDSLEECIFQCNLFVQFEGCDYLIYTGDSGEDENCHLHQGDFTFQDYFNTCSMSGQPVFNDQDNCFANSQDQCPSEACQGDCQQCGIDSPDDQDCWGVRESDCSMTTAGHKIPREVDTRDECQQICTEDEVKQGHGYTYFTWNTRKECFCFTSGEKECLTQVIAQGIPMVAVEACFDGRKPPKPIPTAPEPTTPEPTTTTTTTTTTTSTTTATTTTKSTTITTTTTIKTTTTTEPTTTTTTTPEAPTTTTI